MPSFNMAVLTQKGEALIAKTIAGNSVIEFTSAKIGDGNYSDSDNLELMTDIKSVKQEFGITEKKIIDENTITLKVIINNLNLEEGYYVKEIGIFATDPDEGEILYSISTAVTDQWDFLPSYETTPSTITIISYQQVSNVSSVTFKTGAGALALADDVNKLEIQITEHIDDKSNPHQVTKEQIGLGNVNNIADIDKSVGMAQNLEVWKYDRSGDYGTRVRAIHNLDGITQIIEDGAGKQTVGVPMANYGRVQNETTGDWLQYGFQFLLKNDNYVWLSDANGHATKCSRAGIADNGINRVLRGGVADIGSLNFVVGQADITVNTKDTTFGYYSGSTAFNSFTNFHNNTLAAIPIACQNVGYESMLGNAKVDINQPTYIRVNAPANGTYRVRVLFIQFNTI